MDNAQPQSSPQLPQWSIFPPSQRSTLLERPRNSLKRKQKNSSDQRVTSLPSRLTASSHTFDSPRSWRESFYPATSQTRDNGTKSNATLPHDRTSDLQLDDNDEGSTRYSPSLYTFGMGSINDGPDEDSGGKPRDRNEMKELPLFNILPAYGSSNRGKQMEQDPSPADNNGPQTSEKQMEKVSVPFMPLRRNPSRYGVFLRNSLVEAALPRARLPEIMAIPKNENESTSLVRCIHVDETQRKRRRENRTPVSVPDSPGVVIPTHLSLPPTTSLPEASREPYPWAIFNSDLTTTQLPKAGPRSLLSPFKKADNKRSKDESNSHDRSEGGGNRTSSGDTMSQRSTCEEGPPAEYNNEKGKHVLGLTANDGPREPRSRLERNKDAQGIVWTSHKPELKAPDRMVWLSLLRKPLTKNNTAEASKKLLRIDIPNDLIATSSGRTGWKGRKYREHQDFDDEYFALYLQAGYRALSENWFIRILGARKVKCIQVRRTSTWSGARGQEVDGTTLGLLTVGNGVHGAGEPRSPFTEASLLRLYKKPATGRAKYTWVHWARRLAASNSAEHNVPTKQDQPSKHADARVEKSVPPSPHRDVESILDSYAALPSPARYPRRPDTITAIQFVCELSIFRILCALIVMLTVSAFAAVLWIFLGANEAGVGSDWSEQASRRIGTGIAIAVVVLLFEAVGFGAWVWLS